METTGKLIDVTTSYETRRRRLTFEVDNVSGEVIDRLYKAPTLDIRVVRHYEKRSNDANAYHWKLCSMLAPCLECSLQETHKWLMLQYGTINEIDGVADYRIVPASYTPTDKEYWKLGGKVHLETPEGEKVEHNLFWVIKESHLYTSKEMSALIVGTVYEAKQQGLDTRTPEEIAQLVADWKSLEEG